MLAFPASTDAPPVHAVDPRFRETLLRHVDPSAYELWFRNHTRFTLEGDVLTVGVPNLFFQGFLENQYGPVIKAAASEQYGDSVAVRFAIDPALFQKSRESARPQDAGKPRESGSGHREPEKKPLPAPRPGPTSEKTPPANKRKWRSLNDFVVGACNRVAFASAVSVVEEPGQQANPLVIYGPVGTGKTHLLEGIYLGLRKRQPDLKMLYVTAEDFVNRFVGSIHQHKQYSFRKQFRECSVLLIDDLNFLARAKASQIEFLHTFDALLSDGAQIVVTCDCHPRLTDDLMPELIDRLIGGAVWSLLPPDAETRLAILRAKSAGGNPQMPEPILKFLSEKLRGNVRELEGAVHSIRHFARATARPIEINLVREALGDLLRHAVRVVTMSDVDRAVCTVLNLPAGTLKSKAKSWAVSHPRMMAIYLCRKMTAATYGEISLHFGNKTHSTAVAAEKKVRAWIEKDERVKAGEREWNVRELLERVERELQK